MCNNAMNEGHKKEKTKRHRNATPERATKSNELTRKQIITVGKLKKEKEECSKNSEPESHNSQSDTDMDEKGKDEEIKTKRYIRS